MNFIESKFYIMSPSKGTTYYGPFETSREACEWANGQGFGYYRVRDGQYMTHLIRDYQYAIVNPDWLN